MKMRGLRTISALGVVLGIVLGAALHARAADARDPGDVREAWRDRAAWPTRFGRDPRDAVQGVVVELPAGRTTHVWNGGGTWVAQGLGWWDTQGDGAKLTPGGHPDELRRRFVEVADGGYGFQRVERKEDEPHESLPPAAAMMFVTARDEKVMTDGLLEDVLMLERTWFSLYDPKEGPARGIAVVMPGLFGTPEAVFDQVVRHFQSRRWVVLRMMAQPSRYTERMHVEIEPASVETTAALMASVFDQRAAECAYAVEAAITWAEDERPEIKSLPRVILGGSGGAMSLPPVAARMPGAFAAAVVIAGGADYATIAATSNYEDWVDSVHLRWNGGHGTAEEIAAFSAAYLEHAKLDAYHTAAALHGVPMLVFQGSRDKAVPAPQQELLWERLGKPERRLLPMGHETLFISLPLRMSGIMDWIDAQLATDTQSTREEGAESAVQEGP